MRYRQVVAIGKRLSEYPEMNMTAPVSTTAKYPLKNAAAAAAARANPPIIAALYSIVSIKKDKIEPL